MFSWKYWFKAEYQIHLILKNWMNKKDIEK